MRNTLARRLKKFKNYRVFAEVSTFLVLVFAVYGIWQWSAARGEFAITVETEKIPALNPHPHRSDNAENETVFEHGITVRSEIFRVPEDMYITGYQLFIDNAPLVTLHHALLQDLDRYESICPGRWLYAPFRAAYGSKNSEGLISFPEKYGMFVSKNTPLMLSAMFHDPLPPFGPGGTYKDVAARLKLNGVKASSVSGYKDVKFYFLHIDDIPCSMPGTFTVPSLMEGFVIKGDSKISPNPAILKFDQPGTIVSMGPHLHAWDGGKSLDVFMNDKLFMSFPSIKGPKEPWAYRPQSSGWIFKHVEAGDIISIAATYDNATNYPLRDAMATLALYFAPDQPKTISSEERSLTKEIAWWLERISILGARDAYLEFKDTYKLSASPDTHLRAHAFAEALYEKEGTEGITICDSSFSFGCYHTLFSAAIREKGESVVRELNQKCLDKFGPDGWGCQHGIGHGIMQYIGKWEDAISLCKKTVNSSSSKGSLFGCIQGVFMEYNMPIIINGENASVEFRKLENNESINEPCVSISDETVRSYCYFELVRWWEFIFKNDFSEIGKACAKLAESADREFCFLAVGSRVSGTSQCSFGIVKDICALMPDAEGELACRAGAYWNFGDHIQCKKSQEQVCQGLGTEKNSVCRVKAKSLP